jgi:hypothetical protein
LSGANPAILLVPETPQKADHGEGSDMMLLSVAIDLGPDATEERVQRFLLGEGEVRYVLTADDSNKGQKISFIKRSYRTALDGVIFSLSTAVLKGRERVPQATAIMKALPAILASVKKVKQVTCSATCGSAAARSSRPVLASASEPSDSLPETRHCFLRHWQALSRSQPTRENK